MTITYGYACSKSNFGTFFKLLARWKGSIYKLIYKESLVYLAIYYALSLTYKFGLSETQKPHFERLVIFCDRSAQLIPLTFILGFYVSQVMNRWWHVYLSIAWPDKVLELVSSQVRGSSDEARMTRRTISRYLNCSQLLVLRDITAAVRKRFPTLDHLVEAGFFTMKEKERYEELECPHHKYWLPIHWCHVLLHAALSKKFIESERYLQNILEYIAEYKSSVGMLLSYDWIPIPLVYTQVVTLAVYSYVFATLIGHQSLDPGKKEKDMETFFPIFPFLQFLFYMGWLKVAETLLNPVGEDDDDFEVNYIVDRNLQIGYLIVDTLYDEAPSLEKDIHWDLDIASVPHTVASAGLKTKALKGSTSNVNVTHTDQTVILQPYGYNRRVSQQRSYPPLAKSQFSKQISETIPEVSGFEDLNVEDKTDSYRDDTQLTTSITGLNIIDPNDPVSIERNQKSFRRLPRKIRNKIRQHERDLVERMQSERQGDKARRTESSISAPPGGSARQLYGQQFSLVTKDRSAEDML